jgi:hypothetical protein
MNEYDHLTFFCIRFVDVPALTKILPQYQVRRKECFLSAVAFLIFPCGQQSEKREHVHLLTL